MDLSAVLADGTDGLGNAALERYYRDSFAYYLPAGSYPGAFRVRAALNFAVQQLATRSRVSPDRERYLQIGGFDPTDLPAALIQAMPHTRIATLDAPEGTWQALTALRLQLPTDAMPDEVAPAPAEMRFALIAVFSPTSVDMARQLRHPGGRILQIHRAHAASLPILTLHDA